ncbi:hypothetical protein ALP42_02266 [Pseudomonas savastanoi pv. nerii]|uniref:Secreted protein n=1 Tax=Pseudomonas savastanoi pv. nerii TaxID=360921 RepID=A0AB74BIN1_PSESS|nr:hypothetical protein ALP79_01520 [Pseudomonas savastanoi pv. fraxini]RML79603.1 hypothetical protein ALQ90_04609 [Pseudomonas savastanoi pv. savastanoi]RML97161.1 hypothetical protein ALQ88_01069 [Pseudomonas savastanoi]RMR76756.1 hypothetical protein ALP81_01602 [Pseudomonas savastanoi pv. fraxini]RMT76114.1 hypothetical protein ALP42_02266 [Pseudomonas savastanoi pv. nerii]
MFCAAFIKATAWLILLHRCLLFGVKVDGAFFGVFDVRRATPNRCDSIQRSSASDLEVWSVG